MTAGTATSRGARNWAGNVVFGAQRFHAPTSVQQLQDIVAGSRAVRALGTGHSFSPVADTTGDLVSVRHLDVELEIDTAAGTATVPAGMTFGELAIALHDAGRALPNMGSLPHISVAGACATGTHGSGDTNRTVSAGVVGVELVRADGALATLTEDDPDLPAAALSLGALGIATRVTLRTEPAFQMRQDVFLGGSYQTLVERVDDVLGCAYSVSVFSTFRDPDVVDSLWIKSRTDAAGAAADEQVRFGARRADVEQHPVPGMDPASTTAQLGVTGPWHERLPHFRREFTPSTGDELQSEFFLPRAAAAEALLALRRITSEFAPALQVFELRSIRRDDLWLSPCHGRDSVGFHFTWLPEMARVRPALIAVQAALAGFQARRHWGKVALADRFTTPREVYPQLERFLAAARRFDPERHFVNEFVRRLVE